MIGREFINFNWVKVEIEKDIKYFFLDSIEILKVCEILVKEGFKVFLYIYLDFNFVKEFE